MNYLAIMELFKRLDKETLGLFTRFVLEATQSGDANAYVKAKLQVALAPPPSPPPKHVNVTVVSDSSKEGQPKPATRVRRPTGYPDDRGGT